MTTPTGEASAIANVVESPSSIQLFRRGSDGAPRNCSGTPADPAAIVWELRGVKSSQGGKYQVALAEVLGLVREGVRGG